MKRFVLMFLALTGAALAAVPVPVSGWKMELIAEAPVIKHPSVVCAAPDGRIFVAEDPMDISAPADKPLGRIICFDTNGTTSVFAEGLHATFGMQYLDGKLFVLHNPKFTVFDDGGKIGRNRTDLIEQTHPTPWALDWNDHVPANFRLGMDGYFYIAVGDKGIYGAVGRDGKRVDLHGGGILRMRPDGTELEVYCTGVRNILDVAMNEEDEFFTYDNTDEQQWMGRVTHMVDGGFYGYPYDFIPQRAYTLWMLADYGPGAATGTLIYNEDALPPEYHGNLFLADFGKRQVMRVKLEREGATYKALSKSDLFPEPPPDFRPVGIGWSADGSSMYICDWQHRDVKAAVTVGRLWRLQSKEVQTTAPRPAWFIPAAQGQNVQVAPTELIGALNHPAHSVRMVAQRLLGKSRASEAVATALRNRGTPERAKWHLIWALDAINLGQGDHGIVIRAAAEGPASVRRQAMKQLGGRRIANARLILEEALKESDPTIRFQAATALGRLGVSAGVPALLGALDEPEMFTRYAVFKALNRAGRADAKAWEPIVNALKTENARLREGAEFALRETYDPVLARNLWTMAVTESAPTQARAGALRLLTLVHHKTKQWEGEWWAYHPVNAAPPSKDVSWEGTEMARQAFRGNLRDSAAELRRLGILGATAIKDFETLPSLRQLFEKESDLAVKEAALEAFAALKDKQAASLIARSMLSPEGTLQLAALKAAPAIGGPEIEAAVIEILKRQGPVEQLAEAAAAAGHLKSAKALPSLKLLAASQNAAIRQSAGEALATIGGAEALAALRPLLTHASVEVRRTAIQALGQLRQREAIPLLITAASDNEIRAAAIEALARLPDVRALDVYVGALKSPNVASREASRRALRTLGDKALEQLEPRAKDLDALTAAELRLAFNDHEKARRGPLFSDAAKALEPKDYLEFAMNTTGDIQAGRVIFYNENGVACIKCHVVGAIGGRVGPEMTTIGKQFGRAQLIESILEPSKVVREGYNQVMIETNDDEIVSGIFKGETGDDITLLDSSNSLVKVKKSNLKSRRNSDNSLMPEGLHSGLSLQDFADLVTYLESLK